MNEHMKFKSAVHACMNEDIWKNPYGEKPQLYFAYSAT